MLCVMNCKKINKCIGNQQCNRHLHFPGQHYSFQGFFQTFLYLWSFSRLFEALKISTLNSRTFHTFPGTVRTLGEGMHPVPKATYCGVPWAQLGYLSQRHVPLTCSIFSWTSRRAMVMGASSTIFWCLLCMEQSRPNSEIALPYLSASNCTSRWRAFFANFMIKIGEPGTSVWT